MNGPFAFGTVDAPEIFHQTSIQYSDTAIWSHSAHTLRFGFQANRYRNNYVPATSSDGAAGQIGFNGTYTGYSEADFFLGLPSYMGYGQGFAGTVGQRNYAIGAFVQDDWRISSKLTLNFGLRWQLFTPIYEVHDRMTNFGEYTRQIELAGQNGNSRALYNQYNGIANFLPRMGAAYSLDNKTVIRAAFSRSSFEEGTGEYNRLATNAPWNVDLVGQWGGVGSNGAIPDQPDHARSGLRRAGRHQRLHTTECGLRFRGLLRRRAHSRHRSQLSPGGFQPVEPHSAAADHQFAYAAGRLCGPAFRPPGGHL